MAKKYRKSRHQFNWYAVHFFTGMMEAIQKKVYLW